MAHRSAPLLLTAALLAAPAGAEPPEPGSTRFGVQYAGLDYDLDATRERARPSAVVTRVAHQLTPHFGLEGRLGIRAGGATARGRLPDADAAQRLEVRLDRLTGLYASAHTAVAGRVSGYALAGYSDTRGTLEADGGSTAGTSARGPSLGLGLDYAYDADYRVQLEYMRYSDRGDVTLEAIGLGLSVRL